MRWLALVGLLSGLAGCAPNRTQAVDTSYTNRLNQRIAQYTSEEEGAKQTAQFVLSSFVKSTSQAGQAKTATERTYTVSDALQSLFEVARVDAHRTVLTRFLNEAAASNQIGAMSSWVSNQATLVISLNQNADAEWGSLQQTAKDNPKDPGLVNGLIRLTTERGIIKGAAEELQMVQNDINGYATDYANAAQQQAQDQARIGAALSSLATFAYQQQELANQRAAIATMSRPITCSWFGNSMSCF